MDYVTGENDLQFYTRAAIQKALGSYDVLSNSS